MKKFSFLFVLIAVALFAVVTPVGAQAVDAGCNAILTSQGNIAFFLCRVALILNTIIPILITLAVVYFIWGVIGYVLGKSEEAKKEGRDRMIWGLVGLAVIVSIWGLVAILKNLVGVPNTNTISVPCIVSPGITCPQTT